MPNPTVPQYVSTGPGGGRFDSSVVGNPIVPETGVLVTSQTVLDSLIVTAASSRETLYFSTTAPAGYPGSSTAPDYPATQGYVQRLLASSGTDTTARAAAAAAQTTADAASVRLSPTALKTSAYTAAVGDLALMNVPGGATALTLPTAPVNGAQVGFVAVGATTAAPLTVTRGGTDTIGYSSSASVTVPLSNEVTVYQYDAANTRWLATSNVKPLSGLKTYNDQLYASASAVLAKQFTGVQVCDAGLAWGDAATTSTAGTSRLGYVAGLTAGQIRLVFVNWFNGNVGNTTFLDTDGTSTVVFAASVEIAGTIYRVTFGGRTQATLDPGGVILSDPIDVTVTPATQMWVRTFLASGTAPVMRITKSSAAYGGFTSTTDLTAPGSGAIAATTSSCFGPAMILGVPTASRPLSVVGIGDSRMAGFRDDGANNFRCINPASPQFGAGGYFQRALSGVGGFVNLGRASDTAASFLLAAGHNRRGAQIPAARRAVVEYGINDMFGSATAQTVANNNLLIGALAARSGMLSEHLTTLEPVSTSTDLFATTAGQTTHALNAQRVIYNNWVRGGAPIDPTTFTYVPVGTAGALTYGMTGHPYTGYFEVADQVESARDSGLWKAAERAVADGAMTASSNTLTSATANFTSGDVGKDVNVAGAGTSGANLYAIITAYTNATTVTLGTSASTTVSAAQTVINPWTPEGVHGNERANAAVAAVIKPLLVALT